VSHLIDQLLTSAPPALVYLLVFLVPALEASVFVGFVLPGETAVLLGGAIAAQSRVHVTGVLVAAVLGAVIGDTVGYLIGRRFGGPLQQSRLGRVVAHADGEPPRTSCAAAADPACSWAAGQPSCGRSSPPPPAWPGRPTARSPSGTSPAVSCGQVP
jgi:hypothetical protein